jgi:Transposase IS116/IS110/IS902 family
MPLRCPRSSVPTRCGFLSRGPVTNSRTVPRGPRLRDRPAPAAHRRDQRRDHPPGRPDRAPAGLIPGVAPACAACGLIGGGHSPGCASKDAVVLGLVERLDEITGVGVRSAQVIIAELGTGMSVFPAPGHAAARARLTPRTRQSGPPPGPAAPADAADEPRCPGYASPRYPAASCSGSKAEAPPSMLLSGASACLSAPRPRRVQRPTPGRSSCPVPLPQQGQALQGVHEDDAAQQRPG